MKPMTDPTHDPKLRSWVESANAPLHGSPIEFPIQNLPFGVFRTTSTTRPSLGVAIGDKILDLRRTRVIGLLDGLAPDVVSACEASVLNPLFALGGGAMRSLRSRLSYLLSEDGKPTQAERLLIPRMEAELLLPIAVGDYTDFYASIDHATNVGRLFRPDQPLLPNYRHVPIGYHGRASSLMLSPDSVRRPCGQSKRSDEDAPRFAPCQQLDYEMEIGFVVGAGNELGTPIRLERAEEHIAGLCLLNDWSARDVQAWEYQPLGPFLSKSFATSLVAVDRHARRTRTVSYGGASAD